MDPLLPGPGGAGAAEAAHTCLRCWSLGRRRRVLFAQGGNWNEHLQFTCCVFSFLNWHLCIPAAGGLEPQAHPPGSLQPGAEAWDCVGKVWQEIKVPGGFKHLLFLFNFSKSEIEHDTGTCTHQECPAPCISHPERPHGTILWVQKNVASLPAPRRGPSPHPHSDLTTLTPPRTPRSVCVCTL